MKESPKTQPRLTDPHSVSNTLDAETSARIIERLEIRGKDLVFRELFQCFFEHLYGCEHVLEIGCGTGVVLRSLIKDPLFKGRVTGLDLSAAFIGAANRLAAEEGLPVERISFAQADANQLPSGKYDAIVLNTLISHVNDPATVLSQAAGVAVPGAVLIVMDGDYGSLSFAHPEDQDLGLLMDRAFVNAVYAKPDAVRQLAGKLRPAGWLLESVRSKCVSEVGGHAQVSYWKSFAKAYMPCVVQAGLVTQKQADNWWCNQQRALDEGRFFAAASYFTFVSKKVL